MFKYKGSRPKFTLFDEEDDKDIIIRKEDGTLTDKEGNKLFTQDDVNHHVAEERRAQQERNKTQLSELEALRKKSNLNNQERERLDKQINDLKKQVLTKEELAAEERERVVKEYTEQVETLTNERNDWQTRFTTSQVRNDITAAASENKAVNPSQIIAILQPMTHVTEAEEEGQKTGKVETRVDYQTIKDGKPVTLDLTVAEAVKQMKESEAYWNLFEGEGTGGLNRNNKGKSGVTELDNDEIARIAREDPAKYRELKKEGKI